MQTDFVLVEEFSQKKAMKIHMRLLREEKGGKWMPHVLLLLPITLAVDGWHPSVCCYHVRECSFFLRNHSNNCWSFRSVVESVGGQDDRHFHRSARDEEKRITSDVGEELLQWLNSILSMTDLQVEFRRDTRRSLMSIENKWRNSTACSNGSGQWYLRRSHHLSSLLRLSRRNEMRRFFFLSSSLLRLFSLLGLTRIRLVNTVEQSNALFSSPPCSTDCLFSQSVCQYFV